MKKGGVAIALSPKAIDAWKRAGQPEPIRPKCTDNQASRIIAMELHLVDQAQKVDKIFVVSAYLPCSSYSDDCYDQILTQLEEVIQRKPKDAFLILGGDFNASIGNGEKTAKPYTTIGPYGNQRQNSRGETLLSFLEMHKLTTCASYYKKREYDTWSFGNKMKYNHQIDHILIQQHEKRRMRNCQTHEMVQSDHRALTTKFSTGNYIPQKCNKNDKKGNTEQTSNKPQR